MNEMNLKCHYQMVKTTNVDGSVEYTVHEAFSTDEGGLYMISPVPVYIVGDSKVEISELTSMIDKDIEQYGTADMAVIQPQFDMWSEYTDTPILKFDDDEEALNPEEEFIEKDFYDENDKVLDLCDYMKRKR